MKKPGAIEEQASAGPGLQSTTAPRGEELPHPTAGTSLGFESRVSLAESTPGNVMLTVRICKDEAPSPRAVVEPGPLEAAHTVPAVAESRKDAQTKRASLKDVYHANKMANGPTVFAGRKIGKRGNPWNFRRLAAGTTARKEEDASPDN